MRIRAYKCVFSCLLLCYAHGASCCSHVAKWCSGKNVSCTIVACHIEIVEFEEMCKRQKEKHCASSLAESQCMVSRHLRSQSHHPIHGEYRQSLGLYLGMLFFNTFRYFTANMRALVVSYTGHKWCRRKRRYIVDISNVTVSIIVVETFLLQNNCTSPHLNDTMQSIRTILRACTRVRCQRHGRPGITKSSPCRRRSVE